jgi:hypothetical protein
MPNTNIVTMHVFLMPLHWICTEAQRTWNLACNQCALGAFPDLHHPQLIDATDSQVIRSRQICAGIVPDSACAILGLAAQQLQTASPGVVAERLSGVFVSYALRLGEVMPLLEAHPQVHSAFAAST